MEQNPSPPSADLVGQRKVVPSPGSRTLVITWLVIMFVLGGVAAAWILAWTNGNTRLWKPNTGRLTGAPVQTVRVVDRGRSSMLKFLTSSTQMPEIEITVNAQPARFVVDTGSTSVCVLSNAMEKLGLQADAEYDGNHYTAQGRDLSRRGYVTKPITFGLGDGTSLQIENVLVIPGDSRCSFHGLISVGFLEAIGATVDLRNRVLRIEGTRGARSNGDAADLDGNARKD